MSCQSTCLSKNESKILNQKEENQGPGIFLVPEVFDNEGISDSYSEVSQIEDFQPEFDDYGSENDYEEESKHSVENKISNT